MAKIGYYGLKNHSVATVCNKILILTLIERAVKAQSSSINFFAKRYNLHRKLIGFYGENNFYHFLIVENNKTFLASTL